MTRMPMVAAVLLALGACGGQRPATTQPTPEPQEPTVSAGALVPNALVDVRCAPDAAGAWSASGRLENTTKQPMSFDVVVHLGPVDGQPATAHVKRVRDVAAGKSQDFTVTITEDTASTGPCHVQVRAAADDQDD